MPGYDFENIKDTIRIEWFIQQFYGADVEKQGSVYKVLCCFHKESTPSLAIYEGKRFTCFGCGQKGDLVDLVAQLEGIDTRAAVHRIAELARLSEDEYRIKPIPLPSGGNVRVLPRALPQPISGPKQPIPIALPAAAKRVTPSLPALVSPMPATAEENYPRESEAERQRSTKEWEQLKTKWPAAADKAREKLQYTDWHHIIDYDYNLPDGTFSFQVRRFEQYEVDPQTGLRVEDGHKKKKFSQCRKHPDGLWIFGVTEGSYIKHRGSYVAFNQKDHAGRESEIVEFPAHDMILYHADELVGSDEVFLVEGEKDTETLRTLGFYATTAPGGAKREWLDTFTDQLRNKTVIHIPDTDTTGSHLAAKVEMLLRGAGIEYIQIALPQDAKDITQYLDLRTDDRDTRRDFVLALKQDGLFSLRKKQMDEDSFVSALQVVSVFPGDVAAFLDSKRQPRGIMTGFDRFDEMTLGLKPGELIVIAARPAMGKTALLGNISTNVASQGKTVAGICLEMSRESMFQRAMCSMARVDFQHYKLGSLTYNESVSLQNSFYKLIDLPYLLSDKIMPLEDHFEKLLKLQKRQDLGLVWLDYMQLAELKDKNGENRTTEVSKISRMTKLMAKELNVPFIALSQVSRACEQRPGDHRPILSDLRESGGIEQDADMVGFIFREYVYRPDKEALRHVAEFILAKQRNGPTGRIRLGWDDKTVTFHNLTGAQEPDYSDYNANADDSDDSQPRYN